jgi:ubiquinone/menaquinone biosynthesis C-methylase UbiE
MKSLPFDGMADLYDETRIFDRRCFSYALDYLGERFPPQNFNKVFEPGIGTGRIAIPLAEMGYHVTGVDISPDMLAVLQNRLGQVPKALHIAYQQADVTELPFPDDVFDMAIVVHLFYFIKEWKNAVDELLRIVRDSGPIVLMHTGTGTEIPFLTARYKELSVENGFPIKEIGVKSTIEVVDYFRSLGTQIETVRDRWEWTSNISLDKALGYMKSRAYSFTTATPDSVHLAIIEKLESEVCQRFGSLTMEIKVPNQIYLVLILRK